MIRPVVVEMDKACTFPDCDCDSPYRAEGACAQAAERAVQLPRFCTCDGAGRGPGRSCVVNGGGRLGDAWTCREQWEAGRAAVAALPAAPAEPVAVAWTTGIEWQTNPRAQSEQVVKITRQAQPQYGFTVPLYAAPAPAARVDAPEREGVDDALLIVQSYGPWGADLNDAHRRQIVLADEVVRLRGLYAAAVQGRADFRQALRECRATAPAAPSDKCLTDFEVSQMMHAAGMQGGTDDGAPWWLVFARAVERRTAARVRAALATAPAAAAVPVPLNNQQMLDLVLPLTHDAPTTYLALCYESGPYSVTQLRSVAVALIRAVERAHGITQPPGGER